MPVSTCVLSCDIHVSAAEIRCTKDYNQRILKPLLIWDWRLSQGLNQCRGGSNTPQTKLTARNYARKANPKKSKHTSAPSFNLDELIKNAWRQTICFSNNNTLKTS